MAFVPGKWIRNANLDGSKSPGCIGVLFATTFAFCQTRVWLKNDSSRYPSQVTNCCRFDLRPEAPEALRVRNPSATHADPGTCRMVTPDSVESALQHMPSSWPGSIWRKQNQHRGQPTCDKIQLPAWPRHLSPLEQRPTSIDFGCHQDG